MKRITTVCDICRKETVAFTSRYLVNADRRFNDANLFIACKEATKNVHTRSADICDECFNAVNEVIKKLMKEGKE